MRLWLEEGSVEAADGSRIELEAESICIHGDGPNALDVVRAARRAVTDVGCQVAAPSDAPVAASQP